MHRLKGLTSPVRVPSHQATSGYPTMLAALQNRMKNVLHSSSVAPDEADQVTPLNETQDNEQVANDQVAKVVVKGKPSVLVSTTLANNKYVGPTHSSRMHTPIPHPPHA